eukprot:6173973-Pleurochrysis_carterae.AAC.1
MPIPGSSKPLDPSSTCNRPATNAATVGETASNTHAVVDMFLCSRLGAGMGVCAILTIVSGNWSC